jgi:hypothetical protein
MRAQQRGWLLPHSKIRCSSLALMPRSCSSAALIANAHRPVERNAIARPLLQRGAKGRHRLLKTGRPALRRPERLKRIAEIAGFTCQ